MPSGRAGKCAARGDDEADLQSKSCRVLAERPQRRGIDAGICLAPLGDVRTLKGGTSFMNQDIMSGKWKQMRGQVKQWWGRLTDDDLDRIDGAMDKLTGALQERYGWERDQAEREIKKRLEHDDAERDTTRR
jgi:uncharacterized protein YjbJ (UPF0337 family)